MQFVFCTKLFTESMFIPLLLMMSWPWFCSNSSAVFFMTKKKKKKKKNTVKVLKISTHCFLFLQNAYKCSCSPRTYVAEVVTKHRYIAMMASLRPNFIQGWDKQVETEKYLTAIERDHLADVWEWSITDDVITDLDFYQQCPLSRSNNRNNIENDRREREREREKENISVGFEPGFFKRKKIIPFLCLIP